MSRPAPFRNLTMHSSQLTLQVHSNAAISTALQQHDGVATKLTPTSPRSSNPSPQTAGFPGESEADEDRHQPPTTGSRAWQDYHFEAAEKANTLRVRALDPNDVMSCLEPGESEKQAPFAARVEYPQMPCLGLDNMATLSPLQIQFLVASSCFHVPNRTYLDRFAHAYFDYVHPLLPFFPEAEFWKRYHTATVRPQGDDSMLSLFFLQALLFVTCGVSIICRNDFRMCG